MLSNETTTKRHKTHRTLTKEEVVGGKKQKDEQKQQTILKLILNPKILLDLLKCMIIRNFNASHDF